MANVAGSAGEILALLRDGQPRTTTELSTITGQARSTVTARLEELLSLRLIAETPAPRSTGGRPSTAYVFQGDAQFILAADIADHSATFAIMNLRAEVLSHWTGPFEVHDGPEMNLPEIIKHFNRLLEELGKSKDDVIGVGIGMPAPVDYRTGIIEGFSSMPAWNNFNLAKPLEAEYQCRVGIDNDANILAMGEQRSQWPNIQDLLYVKIGDGIGAGIIESSVICRGADGVAGDIGHIYTPDALERLCICGNRGCLVAFAAGRGIATQLHERGYQAEGVYDVLALAQAGDGQVAELVKAAARSLGGVLAMCVSILNPEVIVIGGEFAAIGQPLVAGVREAVYGRARPHATQKLQVVTAADSTFTGVIGATHMMLDTVLHPQAYEATFSLG